MNILFISSGNSKSGISPIVKNQGDSLIRLGHHVEFYTLHGKGIKGYISSSFKLRKFLRKNQPDVVHVHYGICGISFSIAQLGLPKRKKLPFVISFMGDDLLGSISSNGQYTFESRILTSINKWIARNRAQEIIVKSEEMSKAINNADVSILPNGVNFELFRPISREDALKVAGWDADKKHILFASDPLRPEKNYTLTKEAFQLLNHENIELHELTDIPNLSIPFYMNAADVVLLSSFHEGSPNVIKEAMACNRPIVTTPVGDVREIIGNTTGCFIVDFHPQAFSLGIKHALEYNGATNGRENIKHLDASKVAQRLIEIYENAIKKCVE